MERADAVRALKTWLTVRPEVLGEAVSVLIGLRGGEKWIADHPEIFIHPRETIDEATLGIHQSWTCNLDVYRETMLNGRPVYLFTHHILSLKGG